ncbi:beta-ketoacyl-[acyl-carrier-protein] synthase family protein [Bythopirellula polymerisocia]|uniref:beta-ketoacyl-[acyl-carrier-protein] synthase family protein n=1 Tax=Bythopirellula polymerisocia TaxID=2528003 RepID=UPI0011B43231|nr:beta-ketoacyl-[acyl-carrier-protein] synthase family protein [Bythopirellula polymerisocia]
MQEVVITGMGIVCPLGIGSEAVWSAIEHRASGVRTIPRLVEAGFPVTIGGEVPDFDGKQYVQPRKSLKVMCRETQLAFTAAELAWADAQLTDAKIDAERLGVVLGSSVFRSELPELTALYQESNKNGQFDFTRWDTAIKELYPLWMLKYLPNMSACHIGIAKDARGPNNTIVEGDVSSLLAMIEATDTITRGHADVMLTGATGSLLAWVDVCWHGGARMTRNNSIPSAASRPFDSARDGFVMSEGSAVFVLESRTHAEKRGAKIFGRILGYGRRSESVSRGKKPTGQSIRQAIQAALEMGHVSPREVGHVNAHGLSTIDDDAVEAAAIQSELQDVPVTAPKSFVGNSGASGGAIELAISLLGLQKNQIPPTLNCDDPIDSLNVVRTTQIPKSSAMLALNHKLTGQAVALLVSGE